MLGNSAGRRIIQYLDSSAGIVQPTRIVCCAHDEPAHALALTAAAAPKARIHFETVRIVPTPLPKRRPAPSNPTAANVSWFKQSSKPCRPGGFVVGYAMYGSAASRGRGGTDEATYG